MALLAATSADDVSKVINIYIAKCSIKDPGPIRLFRGDFVIAVVDYLNCYEEQFYASDGRTVKLMMRHVHAAEAGLSDGACIKRDRPSYRAQGLGEQQDIFFPLTRASAMKVHSVLV